MVENIKVHRFVQNQNDVGFFCALMEAARLSEGIAPVEWREKQEKV